MADCAMSSTFGLLTHLSIEELKEILNNNEKFENITKEAKISRNDNSDKEMVIASNKSLAEFNLSRSEEFKEKKSQLSSLYEELQQINSSVEAKIAKIKELSKKTDSESVLALLQAAVSECERETDDISEKLLNGDIKLDTFLEQYPSQRKLMHLRKAKVEKMSEMISRRQSYKNTPVSQITTRMNVVTHANIQAPYSNAPTSTPYPLEPINMPILSTYMPNHF